MKRKKFRGLFQIKKTKETSQVNVVYDSLEKKANPYEGHYWDKLEGLNMLICMLANSFVLLLYFLSKWVIIILWLCIIPCSWVIHVQG